MKSPLFNRIIETREYAFTYDDTECLVLRVLEGSGGFGVFVAYGDRQNRLANYPSRPTLRQIKALARCTIRAWKAQDTLNQVTP